MSWFFSLLIAVVTAAAGMVAAGFVANLSVGWHRISGFEGKSGFFVVGMALLGLVAGFVVGVVASRVVGAETLASNAKGLAAAIGAVAVLAGVAAGGSYLTADFPPTLRGRELEMDVEVRLPEGVDLSALRADETSPQLALYSGQAWSGHDYLRVAEARQIDGRWIVPATLAITSSQPERRLVLTIGSESGYYIPIPLAGRPAEADEAWSGWHAVAYRGDLSKPAPEHLYEARYRVRPEAGE